MTTVLLVEDNEDNLKIEQDLLLQSNYQVLSATEGFSAIALAKSRQPDLILMDIHLPEMDGIETTKRLKQDFETQHIPVVAVTAMATAAPREDFFKAGGIAYLTKPFCVQDLLKTIQQYAIHQILE